MNKKKDNMKETKTIELIRSNKRERTVTIKVSMNGASVKYKSYTLGKDEFNYYINHATNSDWLQFLKSNCYYALFL